MPSQPAASDLPHRVKPLAAATPTSYPPKSPFPLSNEPAKPAAKEIGSRLHVGKDIHLKGEITACDRLIVEGKVEASMNSCEIEISESGVFTGEVNIDTADISGEFNGTLTARDRLIVRKTGRVSGTINYGEIEIEPGGEISGQLGKTVPSEQSQGSLPGLAEKNKKMQDSAESGAGRPAEENTPKAASARS
jgi:cytoskeletal protein CcmA (bactofilin family)